jgi:hypothetical protein
MGYIYSHDYGETLRIIVLSIIDIGLAYWVYAIGFPKIAIGAVVIVGILLLSHYIREYMDEW